MPARRKPTRFRCSRSGGSVDRSRLRRPVIRRPFAPRFAAGPAASRDAPPRPRASVRARSTGERTPAAAADVRERDRGPWQCSVPTRGRSIPERLKPRRIHSLPARDRFVVPELAAQVLQHAQAVQRVDVARDRIRHADRRAIARRARQHRRWRPFEVFDDRERSGSAWPSRRASYEPLWIQGTVVRPMLLAPATQQVCGHGLVREPLVIQRNADAERRGTAPVRVQLECHVAIRRREGCARARFAAVRRSACAVRRDHRCRRRSRRRAAAHRRPPVCL